MPPPDEQVKSRISVAAVRRQEGVTLSSAGLFSVTLITAVFLLGIPRSDVPQGMLGFLGDKSCICRVHT